MSLRIVEVPCLSDNYAYLVTASGRDEAVVVDPSAAGPVATAVRQEGLKLAAVLATHHHYDHVGGVGALAAQHSGLAVYAHSSDRGRVPGQTADVEHEQRFTVAGLEVRPLHVPGHTSGAVAYVIEDAAFTGDTLFVAGCGRLFEGTAAQMLQSLTEKLATLPADTRVYCGHEYTVTNLRFARTVEPDNAAVRAKLQWAEEQISQGAGTVPSTIGEELETNPFLRCDQAALKERYGGGSTVDIFAQVRRAKDRF